MAKLIGIATHQKSHGEITKIQSAQLNCASGLSDYRGCKNPKTSVTILSLHAWQEACQQVSDLLPLEIDWTERRANLLVDHLDFNEQAIGKRLQIGEAIFQITCETDPCSRMDALANGLKAALTPNWRGGARCQVIQPGRIAIGDEITWLD